MSSNMESIWQRIFENFFGRLDGPLHFRFIFQPLMAVIFAVVDGIKDAKAGKPTYLWAVMGNPKHRLELLKDGWKRVGKIFIFAVILDIAYQIIVLHWIFPGELIIVAFVLVFVPYVLLRGPVNRIVQMLKK
ncbi:MAG: hypothetical protein WCG19_04035 [Chlorobiaceae bacterium]